MTPTNHPSAGPDIEAEIDARFPELRAGDKEPMPYSREPQYASLIVRYLWERFDIAPHRWPDTNGWHCRMERHDRKALSHATAETEALAVCVATRDLPKLKGETNE